MRISDWSSDVCSSDLHSANLYLDMRLARFGWADLRGLIDYAYTDSFYTYAYQLSGPGDAGFDPSKQVADDVEVPSTGMLNLRLSLSNVKLGSKIGRAQV